MSNTTALSTTDAKSTPASYQQAADVTFFKTRPSANKIAESVPKRAAHSEIDALITELKAKIKHTQQAEIGYKQDKRFSLEKGNKLLIDALRNLAKERAVFCKLKFTLENGLTFVYGDKTELDKQLRHMEAVYLAETKRIFIPITTFIDNTASLEQTLRHELHHAFVNLQNFKQLRFLRNGKTSAANTPCQPFPYLPADVDVVDCTDIDAIIQKGLTRAKHLLDLLAQQKTTEKKIMRDYLEAFKNYKPHYIYYSVSVDFIKDALRMGVINKQLEIIKKDVITFADEKNNIDFFAIEHKDGFYWVKGRRYADDDPRAPLIELQRKLELYENLDGGTKMLICIDPTGSVRTHVSSSSNPSEVVISNASSTSRLAS